MDSILRKNVPDRRDQMIVDYKSLTFNVYIDTQGSESNMINRFRLKFGEPEKVLILFGDYYSHHIKYKASVKNNNLFLNRDKNSDITIITVQNLFL